jgi:UDP-glucose 4-epimerase
VIGYDPPLQLIHRDDCIEAMVLATKRGPGGAYNIGPPGNEPLSSLLDGAGKLHAPLLPPFGLGLAAFTIRTAGIAFLSPQLLDLLRWGRTLNTAKTARELGFRAARDTRAAFEDFTQQRRVLRYEPDRHAYQYEKELEDFIHSRQPAPADGDGEVDSKPRPRPRRPRALPHSRS